MARASASWLSAPACDEDVLGRAAARAGGLDRLLDALARREPELDDDVGQEARPAGARRAAR